MTTVLLVAAGWLSLSVAFGLGWTVAAVALKAARLRWPRMAVDLRWAGRTSPRGGATIGALVRGFGLRAPLHRPA